MSATWEDPRRVLARYGFRPKRSFSQNFLISERAVRAIVEACQLTPDSRVVELGPGCGTLTHSLAQFAGRVIAVELDYDMLQILEQECDPARVTVVRGDAKQVEFAAVSGSTRSVVTGNLPYAITGAIMRNLGEQSASVERAVLMVQREVRDRMIAAPDTAEYGALTVFMSQVFSIETILHLPRTAFHPPPKVTSSVLRLVPLPEPRAERSPTFERVVRAAFQARRKTLRNALAQQWTTDVVDGVLGLAAIDGKRRGETLSVEEFDRLARAVPEAHRDQGAETVDTARSK